MFQLNNLRRLDALLVYLVLEGGSALFFHLTLTIYVVYWTTAAGLDPFQIMLVAAAFEGTIFLFEIPTGVVADSYSRRLSIIIGVLLAGIGLLVQGLVPTFVAILAAEVVSGIGATFLSGATQAWVADELGEEHAGAAFVRGAQARTLGGMIGTVLSVMLASENLSLPVTMSGVLMLCLAAFLAVFMPERGFRPTPHAKRSTWRTLAATFRSGVALVRMRRLLLILLAIEVVFAIHTEGFDQLWQAHFLENFTLPSLGAIDPVVWFGIFSLGANGLSIALNEIVRRRVRLDAHESTTRALMSVYALMSLGIFAFSLAGQFALAIAAYWLVAALRGVQRPMSEAWLNQHITPERRATMFSMAGQLGSIGETLSGPPVGALGTQVSLRAALAAGGTILMLTLPLFRVALKVEDEKQQHHQEALKFEG